MQIKLPTYVQTALSVLYSAGYEGFVVGGCVRDVYLGKEPEDWDITTNATPDEMLRLFDAYRTIPTGVKHGTVTVVIDGRNLEITTYRIDGKYVDGRRPKTVTFSRNITEDLARRDFTVNALAFSEDCGILDLYGGLDDLHAGTIRCVGEPDVRFTEDALRIMRALRFSSVLGFEIETNTKKSILKNCELLNNISSERIAIELLKLLCGKNVTDILIEYRDVFAVVIPELKPCFDFDQNNKHHIYNVYDHIAYSVGFAPPEPKVRLALLLHDIGKPSTYFTDDEGVGHFYGHADRGAEIVLPILERLRFSREMTNTVYQLVKCHDYPITAERKIVRRRLRKFGETFLRFLMKVKVGDALAHNPKHMERLAEIEEVNKVIDAVITDGDCFDIKSLAINGRDLMDIGFESGPKLGHILNDLLSEIVDGKLDNSYDVLLARAKEVYYSGTIKT